MVYKAKTTWHYCLHHRLDVVKNIYKRISTQSPLGMSFTANNPTLQLPLTNHFCVFMLGSQLWLANLAKLPLGPASRTLEIMKIKNHNNIWQYHYLKRKFITMLLLFEKKNSTNNGDKALLNRCNRHLIFEHPNNEMPPNTHCTLLIDEQFLARAKIEGNHITYKQYLSIL